MRFSEGTGIEIGIAVIIIAGDSLEQIAASRGRPHAQKWQILQKVEATPWGGCRVDLGMAMRRERLCGVSRWQARLAHRAVGNV
jgi:hypothetical protein